MIMIPATRSNDSKMISRRFIHHTRRYGSSPPSASGTNEQHEATTDLKQTEKSVSEGGGNESPPCSRFLKLRFFRRPEWGIDISAQGSALGTRINRYDFVALQGRNRQHCVALSGLADLSDMPRIPRALPGADMSRPFRPKSPRPRDFKTHASGFNGFEMPSSALSQPKIRIGY